jgi:hypothetical protein
VSLSSVVRVPLAVLLTLTLACGDPVSPPMAVVGCYEIRMALTPQHPNEVGAWDFRPGGFNLPERIELLINASLLMSDVGPVRALPRGAGMIWGATWIRRGDDRMEVTFGQEYQFVELDLTWSGRTWRGIASDWDDVGSTPDRTAPAELRSVSCPD